MSFRKGFVWGSASASYQVEGAAFEDGKGLSVWDMLSHQPGKIHANENGDVACDHYHRYQEDVNLMQNMGLQAYRMSISWPRVIPDGIGKVNEKGLDFYDRLIDKLLASQITPWVTLFHWDYPYSLFLKGGWLNPDSPKWFEEYTKVIINRFSDRVTHWITQNEPQCYIGLGHYDGDHAPGLKMGLKEMLLANHHSMIAHGLSVQAIRANCKRPAKIGAAPIGIVCIPETNSLEDIKAAEKASFMIRKPDEWNTTLFVDPILLGKYPDDAFEVFKGLMPSIKDSELKTMCQPLDFFGANFYKSEVVRSDGNGGAETVCEHSGIAKTLMNWYLSPESLYYGPKFLQNRYKLPIVITENGLANMDWINDEGKVPDPQRIDYMTRYLKQLKKAAKEGVDIQGYFHWCVMDNFEWALGYSKRFGLIHVDFRTQKRTPKESSFWFKKVIQSNGEILGEPTLDPRI